MNYYIIAFNLKSLKGYNIGDYRVDLLQGILRGDARSFDYGSLYGICWDFFDFRLEGSELRERDRERLCKYAAYTTGNSLCVCILDGNC